MVTQSPHPTLSPRERASLFSLSLRQRAGVRAVLRAGPPLGLLAASLLAASLVLLPALVVLWQAADVAPADAAALLLRPLVGRLLANTLSLTVCAALAAGVVGTAAAWYVERVRFPGREVFAVLAAVPLAVPPFISSFAWVSLSPALQSFWGAWLVVTCAYYPLVYLPAAATLRGMDPALEETARALGCSSLACFARVVLPQLRPALLGGMLLVALDTLVEFGAFSLLRFRTFTTEIYAEYRLGFSGAEASLLALVLVLLCLVCLGAEALVRGRARYAKLGSFTRRRPTPRSLGRTRWAILAAFLVLAAATLGVPIGVVLFWLTRHAAAATAPSAASWAALARATAASVGLGLGAAAVTVTLALPLAYLSIRYDSRLSRLLERTAYLAQGMPGIVVALALVSLTAQLLRPLYQSTALLIAAYAILFLPLALVSVRAALGQVQRGLEEAGRSLGLHWHSVAWRVVLPLAGPGLGAAAALVFVSVVTELTATLLLVPIGTRTLATEMWANSSTLAYAAAAPFAAVLVGLSLLASWLLARRFGVALRPA